jgi:hypothetical protein
VVKVIILQLPGVTVNRKRGLHNESQTNKTKRTNKKIKNKIK